MKTEVKRLGWPIWAICLPLFFYFAVHLWFASQGKPFWLDETDGIFWNLKLNLWQLIRDGAPKGQGSKSPLLYVFDRLWVYAWNDQPLKYWDLRLFFRVIPVAAWSGANVFLFAHLWRYFFKEKGFRYWTACLFAFAIAQFTYTNNFGSYYAIESRGYSLWVGFSLLHFLAFWQIVRTKNEGWVLYYLASLGLVLTTYASLPQIFLSGGLLLLDEWRKDKRVSIFSLRQKKVAAALGISLLVGLYYFSKLEPMHFPKAPLSLYGSSVLEVLLKAFHHHSYHAAVVSFPFLFIAVPLYWRKRSADLSICCLHALLLVGNSYVLYLSSLRSGGIFASRYVIYALPSLTFLYVLGMVTIVKVIAGWLEERSKGPLLLPTFVALALLEAVSRPYGIYNGIAKDISRFVARNSFVLHDTPACAKEIAYYPSDFEHVNNECREISGELPIDPGRP